MSIMSTLDHGQIIRKVYDDYVDCNGVIEAEHKQIHLGRHFFICGFETENNNGTIIFIVVTPNSDIYTHMTFEIQGTSQTEIYIYEGSTYNPATGTAGTPLNNNRNSTTTSSLTVVKDPTITADGTLLFSQSKGLGGATPNAADSEGITRREREIILKKNTVYQFKIVSKDNTNIISYCGEWYEV